MQLKGDNIVMATLGRKRKMIIPACVHRVLTNWPHTSLVKFLPHFVMMKRQMIIGMAQIKIIAGMITAFSNRFYL